MKITLENVICRAGLVAQACNSRTQRTEAEGAWHTQSQIAIFGELHSQGKYSVTVSQTNSYLDIEPTFVHMRNRHTHTHTTQKEDFLEE